MGGERGEGAVRALGAVGAARTLFFFIFWRSFLISWRKGRHVGGGRWAWKHVGGGGGGCSGGVGGDYRTLDSLSAQGEEDMYADGAVGVLEERKACGRWGRWVRWEPCCGW